MASGSTAVVTSCTCLPARRGISSCPYILRVDVQKAREAIGHMDMQEVIRRAEDMVTEHMAKQVSLRSKGRLKLMADKV
jgi:hypothetical protein